MTPLNDIKKTKAQKVMGIDCSTNSFAYAIFNDKKLVSFDEITFNGSDVFERMLDAHQKVSKQHFDVSFVCIESSVLVKSPSVAIKMAYVIGAVLCAVIKPGVKVTQAAPITWQTFLGNPNLKPAEKLAIKNEFPNQLPSFYYKKGREIRKDRTRQWCKYQFNVDIDNDNITDAVGLAWYAVNQLTKG